MKLDKSIRTELAFVVGGLVVGDVLICVVFALLHAFDYTVALGALWGSLFAWLSIFLLAVYVQKAADASEEEKPIAQNRLRATYSLRMFLMAAAIVASVVIPFLNYIAALIPFLIPQPVLMLRRRVVRKKGQRAAQEASKEADQA